MFVKSSIGARLRRVTAPREWSRYDLKWRGSNGHTQELQFKGQTNLAVGEALAILQEKLARVHDAYANELSQLLKCQLIISLELKGVHYKANATRRHIKIEVSLDEMRRGKRGKGFTELELELKEGRVEEFDKVVSAVAATLKLREVPRGISKYARALRAAPAC
jgi:hypothetical protein